jgi:hypothetical protein
MKRQLLILSFLLTTTTICLAQFKDNNEPKETRPKGKPDSVVTTYFNVKIGGVKELNVREIYLYNVEGCLIEDRVTDLDSTQSGVFRTVYSYDDRGNYKQTVSFNPKGNLRGQALYSFDPLKRLVEIRRNNIIRVKLLLDTSGNILEAINYHDTDTPFTIFRYKYNRKGLCIESFQSWSKSSDIQKIMYTYNADDDLINEVVYNNSALLSSYTYSYAKYDKNHNWVIRNTYQNGQLTNIEERNIAYK